MRVLVVDDNREIGDEISHALRRQGHDVVVAHDVRDALVALATFAPFGIVITDMRLPEGSGVDVLRMANRLFPDSTRYLISGEASRGELDAARREGLEAIFWKPVSLRNVIEAVRDRSVALQPREPLPPY
jgi:DNA-binding NtrC family response regulator